MRLIDVDHYDGRYGRVLLPICIRYRLDLNDEDKFAIDQPGDGPIILKKVGITTALKNG